MIEILGDKYITEKEACGLIGYSKSWIEKLRLNNCAPPHIRMHKAGKIYYNKSKFEEWVKLRLETEM